MLAVHPIASPAAHNDAACCLSGIAPEQPADLPRVLDKCRRHAAAGLPETHCDLVDAQALRVTHCCVADTPITGEQLTELYVENGKTIREIAAACDTTTTRVNAALRRHGIPRRRSRKNRPHPLELDETALTELYVNPSDRRLAQVVPSRWQATHVVPHGDRVGYGNLRKHLHQRSTGDHNTKCHPPSVIGGWSETV